MTIDNFLRFLIKYFHEVAADDFALLLGFCDALEVAEELLRGIHADDVEAEAFVVAQHVLELVFAQHAVVHENAREVPPDGAVQQDGADAGVHASREAQDDAVVAQLRLQLRHGGVHEGCGRPFLAAAADAYGEVPEQLHAAKGVEHFGVELYGVSLLVLSLIGCKLYTFRRSNASEACGQGRDGVAVAHPHLRARLDATEQGALRVNVLQLRASVLATAGRFHAPAAVMRHVLRAVADAQDGIAPANLREVYLECLGVIDAIG